VGLAVAFGVLTVKKASLSCLSNRFALILWKTAEISEIACRMFCGRGCFDDMSSSLKKVVLLSPSDWIYSK